MFTLKGHLGITRGEVKWSNAPGSALSDSASAPKTENTEINSLQEKAEKALRNFLDFSGDRTDHIIIMSLLKDFQEANKAFAEKNKIAADKLDTTIDVAIGNEKDKIVKDKMLKLRAQRKAELTQAAEKQVKNRDQLKTDIRASQAETRGEVGMTAQSEALIKVLGLDEKKDTAMIETIKALKDVNIASMMKMIGRHGKLAIDFLINEAKNDNGKYSGSRKFEIAREKYGYSSNGEFGNTEFQSFMKFLDAYSNNTNNLQTILAPAIVAYEFAQPANEFLRASTSVKSLTADAKSIAIFLADSPSGRVRRDHLQGALESLAKRPDFVTQVNRLAGTNFTDVAGLTAGLKANPELKAKFLDNLYAEVAIFEKGDNAGKVFTGKTLEAVKEKNENINKLILEKLTAEIARLTKEVKNVPPDEAIKIEAFLKLYEEKGVSFFTGEIRRVGEGMMVNIGERANTAGVGMTWEMFIKGLTLTAGVAIGAAKGIGLTLHYDLLSGRTETETQRINTRLGVGASVSSKFVPFIDAGVSSTDKIKIFGAGRGGLDTTALNVALMQGGGVITLTKLDARADEISQYGERLGAMIGDIATLKSADITVAKITEIMKAKNGGGFKEINPQGAQNFVDKITNRYKALPGIDGSTSQERAWVIRGVIQNEVEKMGLEEKMNDRDGRSYRGFSVGIGQVLGITFPLAAIHFGEYQVDYSYVEKPSMPAETRTGKDIPAEKYVMSYAKAAEGKFTVTVTPKISPDKYILGDGVRWDIANNVFISDKPVTATVGTDGRVTFAQRALTSQKTTSVPNPAQFETVGDYEKSVTDLLSRYGESANWRQKYATRFAPVRNQLFIDASQAGATFETQMNIKGDKKIQEFLVEFKALNPAQKIQALSILVNENAGVSAHRNYNGKVEYGKVHKLTHSPKLDEIYDANELRLLGLEKDADRQARAILIGEKRTWRENIRKNLDAITTKERPVDNLTADKGFFTFQNFAQDNGGKTQFYDLKSQPTTRILKGSLEKSEKIPLVAGAGLLDAAFKDPRYAQRIKAMLIGVNKVRTGDALITAPDLQQILAGQEVKGVKLDAPLAIYRAESAVCGNEMITIGKPSFVGKKNETSTPQPATFEIPGVQEDITPNISVGGVNPYDRVSTIGVSFYGDNGTESTAIRTKPGEKQVITTKPGEVKIENGQVTINGKPIGVANTNGTITINTGTFRLAPGQTIEQFLGTKGIAIPNQTITTTVQTITSTSVVFKDIKQFTAAFNTLTAIDINDNFTYPR